MNNTPLHPTLINEGWVMREDMTGAYIDRADGSGGYFFPGDEGIKTARSVFPHINHESNNLEFCAGNTPAETVTAVSKLFEMFRKPEDPK